MGDFCPGLPDRDRTATGPQQDRDSWSTLVVNVVLGVQTKDYVLLYLLVTGTPGGAGGGAGGGGGGQRRRTMTTAMTTMTMT
eukprot:gene7266-biopygen1494